MGPCTQEKKDKISKALTGKKLSPHHVENIRKGHLGIKYQNRKSPIPFTKLHKQKISDALRARVITEQFREKMKQIVSGRIHTIETRKKISKVQTGRKATDATKAKMSESHRGEKSNLWKGGLMQDKTYQLEKTNIYSANRRARIKNATGMLTLTQWKQILKQFNYSCASCGKSDIKLTKDHIIPLIKGGQHSPDNIQPLCQPCNSMKHDKIIKFSNKKHGQLIIF